MALSARRAVITVSAMVIGDWRLDGDLHGGGAERAGGVVVAGRFGWLAGRVRIVYCAFVVRRRAAECDRAGSDQYAATRNSERTIVPVGRASAASGRWRSGRS